MRTVTSATTILLAAVTLALPASAGPLVPDSRSAPSPVSSYSILGLTHGVRSLTTLETMRIEKLPVTDVRNGLAAVQFFVEPRVMTSSAYRAQLSINGEQVMERAITPGSNVVLEALVPADGEVHAMCVAAERVSGGGDVPVGRRCFDVIVPAGQF